MCAVCKISVKVGSRRTLNPRASEENREVVAFLEQHVIPQQGGYACKQCFSDAVKGKKSGSLCCKLESPVTTIDWSEVCRLCNC